MWEMEQAVIKVAYIDKQMKITFIYMNKFNPINWVYHWAVTVYKITAPTPTTADCKWYSMAK